jgi:hypothetical protein
MNPVFQRRCLQGGSDAERPITWSNQAGFYPKIQEGWRFVSTIIMPLNFREGTGSVIFTAACSVFVVHHFRQNSPYHLVWSAMMLDRWKRICRIPTWRKAPLARRTDRRRQRLFQPGMTARCIIVGDERWGHEVVSFVVIQFLRHLGIYNSAHTKS